MNQKITKQNWKSLSFLFLKNLLQFIITYCFLPLRLEGGETLKYSCVCRPACGKVQYSKQRSLTQAQVRFFCFPREIAFLGKFGPKNQNCQFKLKYNTQTNSDIQNSMVTFSFSIFDWEYLFWTNLVQKVKIVNLS